MKKRIVRYLKHIGITLFVVIPILSAILLLTINGIGLHYGDNDARLNWNNEGPYVFYENDTILNVKYIKGNQDDGFYLEEKSYTTSSSIEAQCHFSLDSTSFSFNINSKFKIPPSIYDDNEKIVAISDIESSYKTFRDFLINNRVIDTKLHWIFGKGHLVLVGDFMDRGFSTTQVLWFIYKLEQEATKHGGIVHFIIGNHELKNMYGDYEYASPKYIYVAGILGKTQNQLYDSNSFLGRWLASKNSMERINGNLFVHGGIQPELAESGTTLDEINRLLRKNYYKAPYPKTYENLETLLTSSRNGPNWYRGYFRNDLSQKQVEAGLDAFKSKRVIVGHTIQSKVRALYEGRVIAIDVSHPRDYHKNWPKKKSEGLLIEQNKMFRLLDNGKAKKL